MTAKTIVFDLDDTLVHEIDYLKSAFRAIAKHIDDADATLFDQMFDWYHNKENVFSRLGEKYPKAELQSLKNLYRNHVPDFEDIAETRQLLTDLKGAGHFLGLITDGFSVTQRNKIKSLDIGHLFDLIVISEEFGSEKPHINNFKIFHQFNTEQYFYIADNVSKDFITPNQLGWSTICLLNQGRNIHPQEFDKESIYLPDVKIDSLGALKSLIDDSWDY